MQTDFASGFATKKIKVNWANECVTGAMLSAIFTIMAAHSGTSGVVGGSFAAHLHDFVIIGGITMSAICGLAGLAIILFQLIEDLMLKTIVALQGGWPKALPFSNLQAAKFVKIFLP
jgi:hypothetical protein